MTLPIPFYFATLDGDDPCAWAPFGTSLSEIRTASRGAVMDSEYSAKKKFSVSILCRRYDSVPDQAISQTIGCLIDGEYLRPGRREYIDQQFRSFSKRLSSLNSKVIETLGFEIYFVFKDAASQRDIAEAIQFKERLVLSGIDEKLIRVDIIADQERLLGISKVRLFNIATLRAAASLAN